MFKEAVRLIGALVFVHLLAYGEAASANECGNVLAADKLIECLGAEFSKADKELNRAYAKLRGGLQDDEKELLKKAQRTWISYRDADCEFEAASASGGQAYQPILISCQIKKTASRTEELEKSAFWPR